MNMLNTFNLFNDHVHAETRSRLSQDQVGRGLARAAVFGFLLAGTALFATLVQAAPVTINVNVTGANGNPAPDATVTVTKAGAVPLDHRSVTGSARTGSDGSTSISRGTIPPQNQTQPLSSGVYRVDVIVGDKHTTTYIHVPDGQNGTTNVDLGTASTTDPRGQSTSQAARNADVSKQLDDQAGYDRAVGRIDEIIEHRARAIEDLEEAIEDYAEANDLRARSPQDARKIRERMGRIQQHAQENNLDNLIVPAQLEKWDTYISLLNLLELWRSMLGVIQTARDDIPSFSYLPGTEADEDLRHASLDRASENLTSNLSANQGRSFPRTFNHSIPHFNFEFHH